MEISNLRCKRCLGLPCVCEEIQQAAAAAFRCPWRDHKGNQCIGPEGHADFHAVVNVTTDTEPRWTQEMINACYEDAEKILAKMKPAPESK